MDSKSTEEYLDGLSKYVEENIDEFSTFLLEKDSDKAVSFSIKKKSDSVVYLKICITVSNRISADKILMSTAFHVFNDHNRCQFRDYLHMLKKYCCPWVKTE